VNTGLLRYSNVCLISICDPHFSSSIIDRGSVAVVDGGVITYSVLSWILKTENKYNSVNAVHPWIDLHKIAVTTTIQ